MVVTYIEATERRGRSADTYLWVPRQDRFRAIVKILCYQLLMVLVTITVARLVVGNVSDAASIGLVINAVKTATSYSYKRLWDRIAWGFRGTQREANSSDRVRIAKHVVAAPTRTSVPWLNPLGRFSQRSGPRRSLSAQP